MNAAFYHISLENQSVPENLSISAAFLDERSINLELLQMPLLATMGHDLFLIQLD